MSRLLDRLPGALLATLVVAILVVLPLSIQARSGGADWTGPVLDAARLLEERHVDPPGSERLRDAALAGVAAAAGDPYTVHVPESEVPAFEKSLQGTYAGIGAEIRMDDDGLVVVSPMDDSPALAAGLVAGDRIRTIDGAPVDPQAPIADAMDRLVGTPGTTVVVGVERAGVDPFEASIVRGAITTRTVRGLVRTTPDWCTELDASRGIHYLRITQFNPATAGELEGFLDRIAAAGGRGLVLDLRGNPGGGLDVAVDVADLFCDAAVLVTVRSRTQPPDVHRTTDVTPARDLPLAMLVDEQSASASEIVAGGLQALGRARVAGARTYGKGSVQEVRPLPYGAGLLKLTIARYELPGGRVIQRRQDAAAWGVDPDPGLAVPLDAERRRGTWAARERAEAIAALPGANGDGDAVDVDCGDAAALLDRLEDPVLAEAAAALAVRLETGDWPDAPADDPDAAARRAERTALLDARRELERRLDEIDARLETLEEDAPLGAAAPTDEPRGAGLRDDADPAGTPDP